ncbi:MAG: hypothetical protein K6B15_02670, partial [Parasporobacterium sp.]|nr:hypothetical protein [Parasporobacterium sp.]
TINEDGSISFKLDNFRTSWDDYIQEWGQSPIRFSEGSGDAYGTCSITENYDGRGTAYNFTGDNVFVQIWNAFGSPGIDCSCEGQWSSNETDSEHAPTLWGDGLNYYVRWETANNGSTTTITFTLWFSADDFGARYWYEKTATFAYILSRVNSTTNTYTVFMADVSGGYPANRTSDWFLSLPMTNLGTTTISSTAGEPNAAERVGMVRDAAIDAYNISIGFSGNRNPGEAVYLGNDAKWSPSYGTTYWGGLVELPYEHTDQKQIYKAMASAWEYNYDYITVEKSVNNASIMSGNSYYSLDGTTFYVYTDANCTQRAVDVNGNYAVLTLSASPGSTTTVYSNKIALQYSMGTTLYVKEVSAGRSIFL